MKKNNLKKYALLLGIFLIGQMESAKTLLSDAEKKEKSDPKQAKRDKKKEKQKKAAEKAEKNSKKSSDSSKDKKSTEKDSTYVSSEKTKTKEKSGSKQENKEKKEKASSKKDKDAASKKTKSSNIISDEQYEKEFLTFGFGIDENAKTEKRSAEKQADRDKKKEKQEKGIEKKKVADKKKADENSFFGKVKSTAAKTAKSVANSDIAKALKEATNMLAVSAIQQGVKKGVNTINNTITEKNDIQTTSADDRVNEEREEIEEVAVGKGRNKKRKEIALSREHEEKPLSKEEEEIEELVEEQEEALEVEPNFGDTKERVTEIVAEEKYTPESTSQAAVVSTVSAPINSGVVIAQGGGGKRGGVKRGAKAKRTSVRRRGR